MSSEQDCYKSTIVVTNNEETGKYAIPPENRFGAKAPVGPFLNFLKY
jgi:hypothetical protein